ncbi:DUF2459 domain-containing protein [Aquimarina sp. AU474]|uniref:DUF2459 domain-containing protein n=1 Tax=Aquimarina sp. AU474 TaxID=2108529 RepID=UPI0013580C74|nr:DUF2459 domain-containing protein [Aquimarina sp. AU474]
MRLTKKILKSIGVVLIIPIAYLIVSLGFSYITVNKNDDLSEKKHSIYIASNGIHLEIIIPKTELNSSILKGITYTEQEKFFSFGWGDKAFYIKTSTWGNFTVINKCKAAFINTPALLHVIRYPSIKNDWVEIKMSSTQIKKMNSYIHDTFRLDANNQKIILPGLGYYKNDDFYEATGNYNCFNTCNTWVNTALKQSKAKACLWTPFDFRLLSLHKG